MAKEKWTSPDGAIHELSTAEPVHLPENRQSTELDRLVALAQMPDNARIQACATELQVIYAKWQCQPAVLSQVVNGVVTVQPGLQALPVSITQG